MAQGEGGKVKQVTEADGDHSEEKTEIVKQVVGGRSSKLRGRGLGED